jgi:hypothetical protein
LAGSAVAQRSGPSGLTLIAPGIIEAILTGRQPSTLQLDDLLKPLPAEWTQQYFRVFNPH